MPDLILVVEDELTLLETLVYNLKHQGYEVETAADGQAALEAARLFKPDLIVLDLMLPRLDGFEVTRILRREMNMPILILTARDEEIDRVLGLEMGADDYLTKPFSMRELLARVKAQLRRSHIVQDEDSGEAMHPNRADEKLVSGNLTINLTRHEASLDGSPVALKPKEFDLLVYFARHRGQVLTREQILAQVWGWDFAGGTRTVDVHVRWLRARIEPDLNEATRLVTVRGVGYRFDG
jgi:DNA-binding response OmpR family regulator